MTLYDTIGNGYNQTRRADPYITERIYDLLAPVKDMYYLDIGCGTGNYTVALSGRQINLTGVDPSLTMLNEARAKSPDISWLFGTAEDIPAEKETFSGIIATLTMHHWPDLEKALREMARVLKPGGRIVFFTSSPQQMKGYWLNHYFPRMLERSYRKMPEPSSVIIKASKSGLIHVVSENYFVTGQLCDLFLHAGKQRPEIYFDPGIRRGISTFASLGDENEIKTGLARLRSDLDSGEFIKVQKSFDSDEGEYLFMVFKSGT